MRSFPYILAILVILIVGPKTNLYAQELTDSTTLLIVETVDGNEFMGTLVDEDDSQLILLTEIYGRVHIPISQIKTRRVLKKSNLIEGEH